MAFTVIAARARGVSVGDATKALSQVRLCRIAPLFDWEQGDLSLTTALLAGVRWLRDQSRSCLYG